MQPARKETTRFVCGQCGFASRKWLGRCPDCGAWDSLTEERQVAAARPGRPAATAQPLVAADGSEEGERLVSGIAEMDRVLGGGIVPGSLVLIGGDPGIGKSTLILQLLSSLAARQHQVLYVTGRSRCARSACAPAASPSASGKIFVSTENCVEAVVDLARQLRPALLAVDSIQTVFSEAVGSAPGSVTQVREATARLLQLAKSTHLPILLVGHVTKDGAIAGPRVLGAWWTRCSTSRATAAGVPHPAHGQEPLRLDQRDRRVRDAGARPGRRGQPLGLFLAERPVNVPGSVDAAERRGHPADPGRGAGPGQPFEPGHGPAHGHRRRPAASWPCSTAVLEKKLGVTLFDHDIFLNVAGGIRIVEPAWTWAWSRRLVVELFEKAIDPATVVCGEVGLAGEVRAVGQMEMRLREAGRLGFGTFLMPESAGRQLTGKAAQGVQVIAGAHRGRPGGAAVPLLKGLGHDRGQSSVRSRMGRNRSR